MAITEIGERDDVVRLRMNGEDVAIYGSYAVAASVFTQPAAFSMQLGWDLTAAELAARFPPRTPFELVVAGTVVQSGWTDSADLSVDASGTKVEIRGRDSLAPLYDGYIDADQNFAEKSYLELTIAALDKVGLGDRSVIASNEANRKAITGGKTVRIPGEALVKEAVLDTDKPVEVFMRNGQPVIIGGSERIVRNTIKATVGGRWLEFLQKEFKKAGLFLWAAVDGSFVLARPNGNQPPLYKVIHKRGTQRALSNVISGRLRNDIVTRYTRAVVYGRAGGGKHGRRKVKGIYVDEEMSRLMGHFDDIPPETVKQIIYHDEDVDSIKSAEFTARRNIAEFNRSAWSLEYTVSGHTTQHIGSGERLVWAPDTVVEVDDDQLGVHGNYYLSEVSFERSPHTTTKLKLMRPEDLVFGEDPKKAA